MIFWIKTEYAKEFDTLVSKSNGFGELMVSIVTFIKSGKGVSLMYGGNKTRNTLAQMQQITEMQEKVEKGEYKLITLETEAPLHV